MSLVNLNHNLSILYHNKTNVTPTHILYIKIFNVEIKTRQKHSDAVDKTRWQWLDFQLPQGLISNTKQCQ